jgi:catechol 2,3-dioxygenase
VIERLNYLALNAADPKAAGKFATEKMGFTLAHEGDDGSQYLKGHGVDPYSLVYKPSGENDGMNHVSYVVQDEGMLEADAKKLEDAGIEVDRLDPGAEWELPASVRFRTPAGHLIQLTTGVNTDVPAAHAADTPKGAPAPVNPDHVGLGAPDFQADEDFWVKTVGLLHSSRIMAPDGSQVMSFLRAPGRFLYHCVVVVNTPEPEMHHYQMSLKSVDSFYESYEALKEAGVDIQWGPLRHGPGHNIAMYFQDDAGYWMEYSVEEEIITDDEHYVARTWTVDDPHVVDEWQTGPPPLGLMGPPPGEEETDEQKKIREQVFSRVKEMVNKRVYVGLSKVNMSAGGPPPIEIVNEHLKYALELEEKGILFAAGPFVDDTGAMVGDGLFVVRADSKSEAEEILAKDPIHVNNFRKCTVYGWNLHEGKLNLADDATDPDKPLSTGGYKLE